MGHAALVFDGDEAIGWCEYGTPDELPDIHHRKEVRASGDPLPDGRITCCVVDRRLCAATRSMVERAGFD